MSEIIDEKPSIGKTGVRSGKTFRRCGDKNRRIYTSQGFVTRKGDNSNYIQFEDTADFDVKCAGVEYSLNKKSRWDLPATIKKYIRSEECKIDKNDIHLILTEKEQFRKQRNYCFSTINDNGYCRESSSRRQSSRAKSRINCDSIADQETEGIQIEFHVVYPCSTQNASRLSDHLQHFKTEKVRKGLSRKREHEFFNTEHYEVEDDDFEYGDDDDNSIYSNAECRQDISLADFIIKPSAKAIKNKRRKQPNAIVEQGSHVQRRIEHCARIPEVRKVKNRNVVQTRTVSSVHHIDVTVNRDDVCPNRLKEKFGDKYLESKSFPRSFAIDVSEMVEHLKTMKTNIPPHNEDRTPFVVLTFVKHLDSETSLYDFHLNYCIPHRRGDLTYALDKHCISITDIVQAAVNTIANIPELKFQQFQRQSRVGMVVKPVITFSDDFVISKPVTRFFFLKDHNIRTIPSVLNTDTLESINASDVKLPTEKICNICFQSEDQYLKSLEGTMLSECGHFFCVVCWKTYLTGRMNDGAEELLCPGYDCKSKIDLVTLLTLIDFETIYKFVRRVSEYDILKSGDVRWCPTPNCGRLIQLKKPNRKLDRTDVVCECGNDICFSCGLPSHWPAQCDVVPAYFQQLKQLGDDEQTGAVSIQSEVRGKKCPGCHHFIEKNGGCPVMTCRCGLVFCWVCVRDIRHGGHSACYGQNFFQGTTRFITRVERRLFNDNIERSCYYRTAVEHRHMRKPYKQRNIRNAVKKLCARLKSPCCKRDFKLPGDFIHSVEQELTARDQICIFLNKMCELNFELYHLIEFIAVTLDRSVTAGRGRKKVMSNLWSLIQHAETLRICLCDESSNVKNVVQSLVRVRKIIQLSVRETISGLANMAPLRS